MVAFFIQHKCVDAFKYEALIQVNLTQSQKTEKKCHSHKFVAGCNEFLAIKNILYVYYFKNVYYFSFYYKIIIFSYKFFTYNVF